MNDPRAILRAAVVGGNAIVFAFVLGACGSTTTNNDEGDGVTPGDPVPGDEHPDDGTPTPPTPMPARFEVDLVPNGVTGLQRVNFAVPLAAGTLTEEAELRILAGEVELPAARRALARFADGSLRSVQVQVEVDVAAHAALTVEVGVAGQGGVELVGVDTLQTGTGNGVRPRVWVVLPTAVLASSQLMGPVVPRAELADPALDAWAGVCDYDRWDTDAFLVNSAASRDVWLFDRVTAMYRGYAITGDRSPLESAYREAAIYRAGMTIANGATTGIAVPGASTDLKYHYSQGLALHYLLTGDDRFREAAEAVSKRVVGMWNPSYDGSDRFWTERHAGFALLAHEWAAIVTDDQAAVIGDRAETAATAYFAAQMAPRFGQTDTEARCFAHTANAHGEGYGGAGCSPWMSAILADALDAYGRRVGGARATEVRASLGRLGRIIARDGRDPSGRPLYWMGVGTGPDEVDDYDEHWGEAAYVVALAWDATGRTDAALRQVADELVDRPADPRRGRPGPQLQLAVPIERDGAGVPPVTPPDRPTVR